MGREQQDGLPTVGVLRDNLGIDDANAPADLLFRDRTAPDPFGEELAEMAIRVACDPGALGLRHVGEAVAQVVQRQLAPPTQDVIGDQISGVSDKVKHPQRQAGHQTEQVRHSIRGVRGAKSSQRPATFKR